MSEAQAGESHDLMDRLTRFYQTYYQDAVNQLANEYPKDSRSLTIQWDDLFQAEPEFAEDFISHPHGGDDPKRDLLAELHEALYNTDTPLPEDFQSKHYPDAHVRVQLPQSKRLGIGDIRSQNQNTYVGIYGQIERVTQQTERLTNAVYKCTSCGNEIEKLQPVDTVEEPRSCPGKGCSNSHFDLLPEKSETVDLRKVKLKQPPEDADGDGKTLRVYLEDDLAFTDGERTMSGMAGERATIHGILKRDLSPTRGRNAKPEFGSYVEGHSIEWESSLSQDIEIQQYQDAIDRVANAPDTLDQLIDSLAPHVAGGERMYQIKRAAVLYLFGGFRKDLGNGEAQRGDLHMLLVGDPATGKSQLLNFIETVSPRAERLSGTDSTGVGLTASANQDDFADGNWVLKPGLLPRASGGHAIVDELDKMGETDNLHEALEDQRIHVAKAGMKATLKTETGLIAAANPEKGRFEGWSDFVEQIDIPPALFSRFDIIHTLHDKQDTERDETIARATLDSWQRASEDTDNSPNVPLSPEAYTAYIAKAKDIEPSLTDAAKEKLVNFYVETREGEVDDDTIPITARAVPGGARLAEAHARANLRDEVLPKDVDVATDVIEAVMNDVYKNDVGEVNADAVETPEKKLRREREAQIQETCGGEVLTVSDVVQEVQMEYDTVKNTLHGMSAADKVANGKFEIKEIR